MPQCGVNFLGDFFEKFPMVIPLDKIPVVHIQVLFHQQCIQFDPFGADLVGRDRGRMLPHSRQNKPLGVFPRKLGAFLANPEKTKKTTPEAGVHTSMDICSSLSTQA